MTRPRSSLVVIVRRQATYALTAFVCAALALEAVIPGAVLPFLDIVPLAILALGLLIYDAVRPSHTYAMPWMTITGALCCAIFIAAALFFTTPGYGRAGVAALVLLTIGVLSLAFWPKK